MKHVLSVGQCGFDHSAISRFLRQHFEIEVTAAATASDALDLMRRQSFALVLVNRVFDADGHAGLEFLREMKADESLAAIPVMLVTNLPAPAEQAIACGAEPGFGKAELGDPRVVTRLEAFLR
jgi:two-component system, chemotaxis family, chemotaxis protein CheY